SFPLTDPPTTQSYTLSLHDALPIYRGVAVIGHDLLGDQDRVLEVVAVPGHEGDQHVLTQSQFAQVGRCAVGQNVTAGHDIAALDDGSLVDVGVLVGTGVLGHVVDVYTDLAGHVLVVVHADDHALGVHVHHHAAAAGLHGRARVDGHGALDARADQRLFGTQAGNGLALHVGAHQCAVGVVVLQERNQRSGHGHDLRGSHVHVMDVLGRRHHGFAGFAASHQIVGEGAVFGQLGVGLGDDVVAFLDGRQVVDLLADLAVHELAVRRLQEAVLVQASVQGHGVDQADVRTFRRLDRAHAAVVGGVHVAHFEAGALAGQTARTQGRDAALVRELGPGVGLVHE